ncbi:MULTISPECIES: hypothetical protein [Achromobacter]|uniref:Toxin coregulated pilus biosynthesis protein E n=1 Tax=Achromobacter mucicolens TaxID=1389922 RepID=A0ABM8LK79_9BURK|nr:MULTISPECIES: hypothetical protein [Achromobacter]AVG43831.1 hypothetical protein MC81_30405 [Achromobacter insolitus]CAB3846764.1 Toxin coregulated pilus biosynthesis protein E [Achromobacter aegrifaciens]CAB3913294.1 Toxin coregulated pilus biosynthesis protein E [Achromobacter mucicolens]
MIGSLRDWFSQLGDFSIKHYLAVRSFRKRRADFYETLCDTMEATAGKKTLINILQDDCERYGGISTQRGYLSNHLADRLVTDGVGKVSETLHGIVPDEDELILGISEISGPGALEQGLRDLTDYTRLMDRSKSGFFWTVFAGGLCLVVGIAMLFVMAFVTHPRLEEVFSMLPADMWTGGAANFRATANFLAANLLLILGFLGVLAYLLHWSLRNLTGPIREKLEDRFIWRAYRDFQAIRFMMTLSVILKPRQGNTINMRDGILMLSDPQNPWLNWHIAKMLERIEDDHVTGAETFDTGILPRDLYFYLSDVCVSHGIDEGLQRTRRQIEVRVLSDVAKRAAIVRWSMFAIALSGLIGIALWHFATIDILRRALQMFYLTS